MPTPTFSELLEQAREVSRTTAEAKETPFAESLFKGLSGFAEPFLKPRERFVSTVSPETGDITRLDRPVPTELSFLESLFGVRTPRTGIPLTQTQESEFGLRGILEREKQTSREEIARIRNQAQEKARSLRGSRIGLDDVVPLEIWRAALGKIGYDPDSDEFKKPKTFRSLEALYNAEKTSSQDFYRDIGLDIQTGKDFLGQLSPEATEQISKKREERGKKKLFFNQSITSFSTVEEAEKANLPKGTIIEIGGRKARIK